MLHSVVELLHNPRTALRLPNQGEQECFHVNQWLNTATFVNNRLTEMVKRIRTTSIRVERYCHKICWELKQVGVTQIDKKVHMKKHMRNTYEK